MGRYAKPCIVCSGELENVDETGENQPYAGTAFVTHGHYGSTVFDPMNGEYLEINICDPCLEEKAKEGVVLHGRDKRPVAIDGSIFGWTKADWRLVEWNPNVEHSDETINVESWNEFRKLREDYVIETRFNDRDIKEMFERGRQRKKRNVT